jgi:drug/metabolite transporter (DMT)-like permease
MAGRYRGITLILISYLLMTGETVAIHQIGEAATPLQFILMRNLGGIVLVTILARRIGIGLAVYRTGTLWLQFTRAALTMISLWCLFYGFAVLPLADATAVTYTRAVFLSLFAAVILKERVNSTRWVAILIGVIGGLIVIRPAFVAWRPDYLVALAGAGLNAGSMVATKALERRDSTLTIMTWLTTLSMIACIPAFFQPWPPIETLPWMLAISAMGTTGLYVGLLAIKAAELSVLAPFDYTRLIMAALFGLIFFHETPDLTGFIGAAVITIACLAVTATIRPAASPRSASPLP